MLQRGHAGMGAAGTSERGDASPAQAHAVWPVLLALLLVACNIRDASLGSNVGAIAKGDAGTAGKGGGMAGAAAPDAGSAAPCPAGFGDCDGNGSNGCETDLSRDRNHCGSCDSACKSPDCTCQDGLLVATCGDERADCNGDPSDGCEVDVTSDAKHCGACDQACPLVGFDVFGATCVDSKCHLTCEALHADCDDDPRTGCEALLWLDDNNCGACGVVCKCNNGHCE